MGETKEKSRICAFLPLIVFLVCYVGCGITFTLMEQTTHFGKFRHVALLVMCGSTSFK